MESYFKYDDSTEINKEIVEVPYQTILTAINQVYFNADEWDLYEEEIESTVTPKEIDSFMLQLNYQKFLGVKSLRIDSAKFTDRDDIKEIHEYVNVNLKQETPSQKVYFISGSINSIVLIPVKKDKDHLSIFSQVLHMAPQLIRDAEQNIKGHNIKNLSFVNPKDLKPRKKQNY
ncbi:MAG: hypothetical protein WCY00_01650 [Candidatus Dojkabacteria bacterium]|jgi:hypothetical protein